MCYVYIGKFGYEGGNTQASFREDEMSLEFVQSVHLYREGRTKAHNLCAT